MTTDEQLALVSELEAFATTGGGGSAEESVLRRVGAICFALRSDRFPGFEVTAVEESAKVLYSARRHERLPGGVESARVHMLSDCARLRRIAEGRRRST